MAINLLVIGGGANSAVGRVHRDSLSLNSSNFKVVDGIFSRNEKTNEESCCLWGIESKGWRTIDELLTEYSDQASNLTVLVLTPTPSHFNCINQALSTGFSIISEKSLATTPKEVNEIQLSLENNKSFLRVTYNYCGYPMVREAKALVTEGYIGKIQQIIAEMPQEGLVRPPMIQGRFQPPQQWRLKDSQIPTVCLDLGVHLYHLISFITGADITPKYARFSNYTQYKNIQDTFYCDFGDEIVNLSGSMWFTKSAIGSRNGMSIRIIGSAGTIHWRQQEPEQLWLALATGEIKIIDRGSNCLIANNKRFERMKAGHPAGFIEAFANVYEDIHNEYTLWRDKQVNVDEYSLGVSSSLKSMEFFSRCVDLDCSI